MLENSLRAKRIESGLSQKALAQRVGLTRQALYSIESNHYLPSTEISLRLANVLNSRVEDLFRLVTGNETVEADLLGSLPETRLPVRAKIARVGKRLVVKPVSVFGGMFNVMTAADGLIVGKTAKKNRRKSGLKVQLHLLQDRKVIEEAIVVAGCDPAMYLAGEHFRRHREGASIIGWTMSSEAAVEALRSEEVHMAGLHLVDDRSGQSNVPYLRRHLNINQYSVIRFATWEQGLIVARGNSNKIHRIEDLVRRGVHMVNREVGSGARALLDLQMAKANLTPSQIRGYDFEVASHFDVARAIVEGKADVGVGVGAVAFQFNLDFVPFREEHYDFVVPTTYLKAHPNIPRFLDVLVDRAFRKEMEALGGYDLKEIGKVLDT